MKAFLLFALFVFPAALSAQTVSLRTGEHSDFTRVALNIVPGTQWRFGRTDDGYAVEIDGATGYALEDFYEIIPRTRITSVVSDSGSDRLQLNVECDCHAKVELWRPNWLLIDITDGPPDRNSIHEAWLDMPGTSLVAPASVAMAAPEPAEPMPEIVTPPLDLPIVAVGNEGLSETTPLQPSEADLRAGTQSNDQLAGLEEMILESLLRAADQDLIELAEPVPSRDVGSSAEVTDGTEINVNIGNASRNGGDPDSAGAGPGITAQTSIESARSQLTGRTVTESANLVCLREAAFDLPNWGDDRGFGELIGARRSAVTGEFDRTSPEAVEDLARAYLYFGFGAEGIQALEIDGFMNDERAALKSIGRILDDEPVTNAWFARQLDCEGAGAFWALLAEEPDRYLARAKAEAIVLEFKSLPTHLQVQLGPRLALRLQSGGAEDLIPIALGRAEEVPTEAADLPLASSVIAAEQGDISGAIAQLEAFLITEAEPGPEAVIRLINLKISEDKPIGALELELLETLLFERRRSSDAVELAVAKIEAQRHSGLHLAALDTISEWQDSLEPSGRSALIDSVFSDGTEESQDGDFLELAFHPDVEDALPETQNEIASRLVDLGFAERAMEIVAGQAVGEVMAQRRYVRAAGEMALGNSRLAAAHLSGISDERAGAILETGIDPEGWQKRRAVSNDDEEDETQTSALQRARASVIENEPLIDPSAQLAEGRALIAESSSLRETVDQLLLSLPSSNP